jgi:hypothetical protein
MKRAQTECDTWKKDVHVPISQIICGQFKIGPDWEKILDGLECTSIGDRVARSMIRVAATRIFADPSQSALEPVVNSLDAYGNAKNTGKFGMGFFSLLYWIQNKDTQLIVDSVYDHNDGLCSFRATIYMDNDVYMIQLENTAPFQETRGVRIHLKIPMDVSKIQSFRNQLDKLKYITSASIYISSSNDTDGILLNPSTYLNSQYTIKVILNESGYIVSDKASGITREILLKSLIVPSSSTKTINMNEQQKNNVFNPTPYVEKRAAYEQQSHFIMLVNSIVVVDLVFVLEKHSFRIVLDLPSWTKIPVSRDDVLLSSVEREFKVNLGRIVDILSQEYKTIVPIQMAIQRFVDQTASETNKRIATTLLNEVVKEKNLLLILFNKKKKFRPLRNNLFSFVSSLHWNPQAIENHFRQHKAITIQPEFFLNRDVVLYTPYKTKQDNIQSLPQDELYEYLNDNNEKICYVLDSLREWFKWTRFENKVVDPVTKQELSFEQTRQIELLFEKREKNLTDNILNSLQEKTVKKSVTILQNIYSFDNLDYVIERRKKLIVEEILEQKDFNVLLRVWNILQHLNYDEYKFFRLFSYDFKYEGGKIDFRRDLSNYNGDNFRDFPIERFINLNTTLYSFFSNSVFLKLIEKNHFKWGQRLQSKFFPQKTGEFSISNFLNIMRTPLRIYIKTFKWNQATQTIGTVEVIVNEGESIEEAYKNAFKIKCDKAQLSTRSDFKFFYNVSAGWATSFDSHIRSAIYKKGDIGVFELPWSNPEGIFDGINRTQFLYVVYINYNAPLLGFEYDIPDDIRKVPKDYRNLTEIENLTAMGKEKFIAKLHPLTSYVLANTDLTQYTVEVSLTLSRNHETFILKRFVEKEFVVSRETWSAIFDVITLTLEVGIIYKIRIHVIKKTN